MWVRLISQYSRYAAAGLNLPCARPACIAASPADRNCVMIRQCHSNRSMLSSFVRENPGGDLRKALPLVILCGHLTSQSCGYLCRIAQREIAHQNFIPANMAHLIVGRRCIGCDICFYHETRIKYHILIIYKRYLPDFVAKLQQFNVDVRQSVNCLLCNAAKAASLAIVIGKRPPETVCFRERIAAKYAGGRYASI